MKGEIIFMETRTITLFNIFTIALVVTLGVRSGDLVWGKLTNTFTKKVEKTK